MSVFAQPDSEIKLIDAASTAGVSWVMLNSYSTDIEHKDMQRDMRLGPGYDKVLQHINSKPELS